MHQTIEDINKRAIKKKYSEINEENIEKWFNENYDTLVKKEQMYIEKSKRNIGLKQVKDYAMRERVNFDKFIAAEIDISAAKKDYILKGTIDLIKKNGEGLEIIDFKTEKKPNLKIEKEKIESHKKQLELYAHIIEESTGKKVEKLTIYYTGEVLGNPKVTLDKNKDSLNETLDKFDGVVKKIENREFNEGPCDSEKCKKCDMRFYCNMN